MKVWNNRLVADAALTADQRKAILLASTVNTDTKLLSAGLLGPVKLLSYAQTPVHFE